MPIGSQKLTADIGGGGRSEEYGKEPVAHARELSKLWEGVRGRRVMRRLRLAGNEKGRGSYSRPRRLRLRLGGPVEDTALPYALDG
jgi:hypothetical protein